MSSVYFFLVAEASAISSAPKTMSRGTFFSRASTSTSITSSRFPDTLYPSQFRHEARALEIVEHEPHRRPAFQFNVHHAAFRAAQHAHEPAPAGRVRRAHAHVGPVAREAREVGGLAQRPVEPRRRHFQALVI